jgi:CRISPR-associated endonuclease Cas3-HD
MKALLSSPEEEYLVHIGRVEKKLNSIFSVFEPTLIRALEFNKQNYCLKEVFDKMATLHDLGKLTKKWQERIKPFKPPLPSHASIGAAYLWRILPDGLKEPISFAVAIHHTDKGLLGDNIEKPDVQAITEGIVDYSGNLIWDERIEELDKKYFPQYADKLNINDLKDMARGLRFWARGCSLSEQHKRRLRASLAHHIIKLCDISAAIERKEFKKENNQEYYGGWLMVETIGKYVDAVSKRME